jgi:putative SOS response-associated peptidase YedK
MCRRYYRSFHESGMEALAGLSTTDNSAIFPQERCDVIPTTFQPVILEIPSSRNRQLVTMRWGMIPRFAKSLALFRGSATMNAKAETLSMRSMWLAPLYNGRCIVPVSGFYEWKDSDLDRKSYAVEMTNRKPFALAALWDSWKNPLNDQEILSYSIITTQSNNLLDCVSTRMPVIVEACNYDRWLTRDEKSNPPYDLLRPLASEKMTLTECESQPLDHRPN